MIDMIRKVEKLTELYYILNEYRYVDEEFIGKQICKIMERVKIVVFGLSELEEDIQEKIGQGEKRQEILLDLCPEYVIDKKMNNNFIKLMLAKEEMLYDIDLMATYEPGDTKRMLQFYNYILRRC